MRITRCVLMLCAFATPSVGAQRADLPESAIVDITRLLMLEDRREYDEATLARLLRSTEPEVRRRAALSVGRIADRRGAALLVPVARDADTAVAATAVFAIGQLRDTGRIAWLDSILADPGTPASVATEAAGALGKVPTGASRGALARFLARAPETPRLAPVVGEALLSIGRITQPRGDVAPIGRWASSRDAEVRWRAAWALFRPRDPAAVRYLLPLLSDPTPDVRSWAARGLTMPRVDSSDADGAHVGALLRAAISDPDRRVRTEAIRALGTYGDVAALDALTAVLSKSDAWESVFAADALGALGPRAASGAAALVDATRSRSPMLRSAAFAALTRVSPPDADAQRSRLAHDSSAMVRADVAQLAGLGSGPLLDSLARDRSPRVRRAAWSARLAASDSLSDLASRRRSRIAVLASKDMAARAGALDGMIAWADSGDVPTLLDTYARAERDLQVWVSEAAIEVLGAVQRRSNVGATEFFRRFSSPPSSLYLRTLARRRLGAERAGRAWGPARPIATGRSEADYRRIVERWIVPAYRGAARPRVVWGTPRGDIELELYSGDAPLAVDYLVGLVRSGALTGIEFIRVVPNFVDQQSEIRSRELVRDEVNRNRLAGAHLSWATSGLDTGQPGYTIGLMPHPHIEGDFTFLGRVVRGMDVASRIERGDRVLGARLLRE